MFAPGTHLGPLVIGRLLGRGGMGEVYEAEQTGLGRRVAVKRIASHLVMDPVAMRRFEREARILARVHGEHIVAVHEFTRYSDPAGAEHVLLVLELVEGGLSLRRVLRAGPLGWAETACVVRQAAEGLALAHEAGIVHRDIKPDNLLITGRGVVKLSDFGLAKALDSTTLSLGGSMLGTSAYIAPELCLGAAADARSDLYSLGATWFNLLTGRTPYRAETVLAMLHQHQQAAVPDPAAEVPGLPEAVAGLVRALLAKRPQDRPASAAALVAAIDALAADGLAVPRLVPELAARAGTAPRADHTPATAPADVVTRPTACAGLGEAATEPIASTGPAATPATRPAEAGSGTIATGVPTAPTLVPAPPAPGPSEAMPIPATSLIRLPYVFAVVPLALLVLILLWRPAPPVPPVPVAPAPAVLGEGPDALAAQLDAALAEARLGDAQRLAETLASRAWRPERVAAAQAAVRSAERMWTEAADGVEQALETADWVGAQARLAELPPDRIRGTRAISERREQLATRLTVGASLAWGEARARVQEELDRGRPQVARLRLLEARPLAQVLGRLAEYDRLLMQMPLR